MQRHLHSVGIFVLVCVLAGSVQAQTFNSLAAFGGSMSDSGNLAPVPGTAHRHQLYRRSRSGRTQGSPRRPLAHRARIRAPADRTTPGTAGVARSGSGFRKARPVSCWPRFQERPGIEGSFIENATVRPVSMPGLATCLPARAAVATNISPRFKAVKKKPEVLAKAKIQLGR